MNNRSHIGIYVRLSLLTFLLVGGLIGLTALFSPFSGWFIDRSHRLLHIHLQTWFFIGGFLLGAGYRIIPQLTAVKLSGGTTPRIGSMFLLTSAVIWIFVIPLIWPPVGIWRHLVLLVVLLEGGVWFCYLFTLLPCVLTTTKEGAWTYVLAAGLTLVGLSFGVGAAGWIGHVYGSEMISVSLSAFGRESFLFLGVPAMAMGISGRVVGKKGDPVLPYVLGVGMVLLGFVPFLSLPGSLVAPVWLNYLLLPGFLLLAWGMRLDQARHRLNVPGFVHGVTVAFVFLGLFILLYYLRLTTDVPILRRGLLHLWVIGFLTILIIGYGTWIIPSAAGRVPINSPSIVIAVYVTGAGTLLRVLGPAGAFSGISIAYGSAYFTVLSFGGGLLQYTGVAIFTVALWPELPPLFGADAGDG